jgi:hypothetical protein
VRRSKIVYNISMSKRRSGPGKVKRSHSYKTKRRLEVKKEMLAERAKKRRHRK